MLWYVVYVYVLIQTLMLELWMNWNYVCIASLELNCICDELYVLVFCMHWINDDGLCISFSIVLHNLTCVDVYWIILNVYKFWFAWSWLVSSCSTLFEFCIELNNIISWMNLAWSMLYTFFWWCWWLTCLTMKWLEENWRNIDLEVEDSGRT